MSPKYRETRSLYWMAPPDFVGGDSSVSPKCGETRSLYWMAPPDFVGGDSESDNSRSWHDPVSHPPGAPGLRALRVAVKASTISPMKSMSGKFSARKITAGTFSAGKFTTGKITAAGFAAGFSS